LETSTTGALRRLAVAAVRDEHDDCRGCTYMQPPTVKLVHAVPLVFSVAAVSLIAPEDRMHDRLRMHNLRTVQKYFHGEHGGNEGQISERSTGVRGVGRNHFDAS